MEVALIQLKPVIRRLSIDVLEELQRQGPLSIAENLHFPASLLILLSLWIPVAPEICENSTKQSIKQGP